MTMHQCPKCELRFTWHTELDDHCRTDHPAFHHDYPVGGVHHAQADASELRHVTARVAELAAVNARPAAKPARGRRTSADILATYWAER